MHAASVPLAPILAAEKSRVPFYIAGGLLVVWAMIVSMAIGMRRPAFPGGQDGERVVIAVSVVLVLATVATAVLTASTPAKTGSAAASTSPQSTAGGESPSAGATAPTTSAPKATTGTPPPPSSPAAGASSSLSLAANAAGQLSYDTRQLTASAGKVTITLTNMSSLEHNVTVAQGSTVLGATPTFVGKSKTLTLNLKPGSYTFYCSVPGHRQAGMEGTLTVNPA